MEKRVLLAIFLAFLVLYVWQTVFVKPVPKPAPGTAAATAGGAAIAGRGGAQTAQPAASTGAGAVSSGAAQADAKPVAADVRPMAAALVGENTERDVRVETHDVIAVFTNRGARLKSWRLKH